MYSDWVDACDAVAKDTVGKDEDNTGDSPRPVEMIGSDELTEANAGDADLY